MSPFGEELNAVKKRAFGVLPNTAQISVSKGIYIENPLKLALEHEFFVRSSRVFLQSSILIQITSKFFSGMSKTFYFYC